VNNNDDEKNNPFIIQYSSFVENTAENEGGAIYLGYYGGEIIRCDFTDNTAYNGGAVVIANNYQKVYYCNFEGNNATMYGGSIYVKSVVNGYIENSTFKHSHAHDGGAIYNVGMATVAVYIINDTFIKNTATHNGGAVYYTMYNSANFKFVYRDYNNFDGRGTPVDGDRTTVTFQYASQTWGDVIVHSYFEENEDYLLNITAELDTNVAIVSLNDPKEYDKNNVKITLTLTYNGVENQTIEINSINYDELFHNGKYNFYDLSIGDYVVYMTFEVDGEYMVKTANYTFNVSEISDIGDFEYIQRLIELKINSSSVDEDVITVVLPRDFAHNRLDREHDKGCINITNVGKPIIITGGNGVVTINAKEACRIFNITASNVTLVNIELFNGNASGQYSADHVDIGGGIYCSGANLTLTNVIFRHNNANIGGGLYLSNSAGNCKIDGCEFISNVAVENGGAIDCNSPNMYLTNTLFESNTADTGAALCREVNASGGSGYNNTFKFNHALTNGSALAWINASRISIDTYFFYNNDAGNSGGAIFVGKGSGNCEIKNCVFENNKVLSFDNGHGGAIEWYASEGLVINSSFTGNKAFEGGAIYVGFGSDDIDIINSNFTDNQAYHYGGAISIEASSITINQSNFNDNLALSGGALYVGGEGTTNIVRLSSFTGNNATDGNGGAINWVASSGQIYDTNFTKNYGSYGGGIYLGGLSTESSIIRCIFEENYADYNGGAIDCNASKMVLNHTVFKYNYAQYGAALCREAEATGGKGINNTFISNHAYIGGAALGWMKSQNITIRNYTFINNTANVYGGAIYVGPNSHNCNISNSTFDQNHITDSYRVDEGKMDYFTPYGKYVQIYLADYGLNEDLFGLGGAVYFAASNGTVVNSNFTNNNASNGGAIYVASDSGNTLINSSTFGNNYASLCGGAINLNASAAHIYDTIFNDNVAVNGSALYVGGVGTHNTIYRSVFERNNASSYGAGIYWIAAAGEIDECNFTSNSAVYGGGIYLNGRSSNTNITNSIFKLNNATKNGGAIECNAQNIGIYNLTFDNNYAGEYGAALCREEGATQGHGNHNNFTNNHAGIAGAALAWMNVKNINIDYYNFINNTAGQSGGAIHVSDGSDNCTINHCNFTGNHITEDSEGYGGAIDITGNGSQIINSVFYDNYAPYGGAVFAGNQSGNTNISNVTFKDNYAILNGGAIQITGSGVTLNDTRFYSNTAGESGGAVYVSGEGTTNVVHYSLFDNNKAGDHGGAINWLAYSGEIFYSNFTNNEAVYGGAIYLNRISSDSRIVTARFENNSATKNGGAIDCNASSMGLNNTVFINNYAGEFGAALCREAKATGGFGGNNTFIANRAGISGAALAWLGVTGININNYTFINNTAVKSGAAIFVREDSPDCKVRNCYFDNNYLTDIRESHGGAIDWHGDNGYIYNTTFKNSFALNGGTVYVDSENMNITESRFESSRTLGEGGTLVICSNNVSITKTNISYSAALERGGAIAAHNANNLTIDDCYFNKNVGSGFVDSSDTAYGEGGTIFLEDATNFKLTNTLIHDSESHGNGALSVINCNDSQVYNVTFYGIITIRNGGSISWIDSNNITIDLCTFEATAASYDGGSIYLNNTDKVIVKNSNFNNTSALWGNGGGIYINGNATFDNNTYSEYVAYDDYAGAIFVANGTSIISNSTFIGPDAIWVNNNATAYVIKNNVTGELPNKHITFLTEKYDARYNKYDYSVWNDGDLYLENNTFDYIIFNNGTIHTPTTIWIINNMTWNETWNTTFEFWANITDDNNNTIISVDSLDTWNDVEGESVLHHMPYNYLKIDCSYQGVFFIHPKDSGLVDPVKKGGTIVVKMPVSVSINYDQSDIDTKEDIPFVVKVTVPIKSNYTFDDSKLHIKINDVLIQDLQYTISMVNNTVGDWIEYYFNFTEHHLPVGTYTMTAEYEGDLYHWDASASAQFTIFYHPLDISIHADSIQYGETLIVNVNSTAVNTVNGRIIIYIDGREVSVPLHLDDDGNYRYVLTYNDYKDYLTTGEHIISVTFYNGTYYGVHSNSSSFEVFKRNTTIVAVPTNITFWEIEKINVTVDEKATGYIKITINVQGNDEEYVAIIENGTAHFNIANLFGGNYTNVKVVYNGDGHFNGNTTFINFTVFPTPADSPMFNMDVSVDNVEYGQNAAILVLVPSLANGTVTISVDGVNKGEVNVTNGLAKLSVSGLAGGTHYVNATYNGCVNYGVKNVTNVEFNVTSTDNWKFTITSVERPYGENTTITISTAPYNVSGKNITITIDNVAYIVNLTNGAGSLTLNNLSVGNYLSEVSYAGDANYSAKSQKFRVKIVQAEPTITLTRVGNDIIASLSGNATGNVTFHINGRDYTIDVINGNATLPNNLTIGNNFIVAEYNGDHNYTSAYAMKNFPVDEIKTDLNVTVTPTSVVVGKNTTITVKMVNVTSGKVIIEVNGYNYTVDINSSGVAVLTLALPVGKYNATAYYLGDLEHVACNNVSEEFEVVNKTVPEVNITASGSIEIDNNLTFTVNTTSNATLTVKINGKVIEKGTDGKYHFNGTVAGNYTITAEVAENDYYFEASNFTTFVVYKHASEITSVIANTTVVVGQNTTITVTMANNETGKVLIEVNGHNYTVKINSEHKAILVVALPADNYTATAYYLGDDKYNATDKTSEKFNVTAKQNANITISLPKVTIVGNNVTITVTNSTPVNVTLNGEVITLDANGNYTFNATVVGNYTVIVRSAETDDYYAGFNSTVFNVVKRNAGVNITIDGVNVIEIDNNITFTVNTNSNGTLVVKVNNKVVTIGADGKYHFNGTVAGNYTITAEVAGNGYYDAVFNSTAFKVVKHNSTVNITVGEKYEIGTSFNITVNNNTVVNVTINGKVYAVKDGKVTINTAELASGNYTVIATIYESDKYYGNITSDTFEIFKHTAVIKNVTVPTSDVVMGKNATITVNMDNVTSGTVLIEVDGHNYTVLIVNKVANLTVELPTGEYNATAYYLGDANYTSATPITSAKFKVLGKERALVNITIIGSDVIEIDNNITFNVTSNSNGTIIVKVNGKVVESIGNNQYRYNGTVAGNYTIVAEIAGNEYYVAGFNSTMFKVIKHNASVTITVGDKYEIRKSFDIGISNATVVNVTINGVKYNVTNGKVEIDTTKLAAGNYTVIATIYESDKYYGNVTSDTFEIFKHTAVIDSVVVPNANTTVGQNVTVTVNMNNVTSGKVLIEINGHNYTVDIIDKVAELTVALPVGEYNATAYFLGDDNYTSATKVNATKFYVVDKKVANITISVPKVTIVGNNVTITVTNSTPVNVTLNGEVITLDANGNYTFNATVVGNYTVIVRSAETDDYYAGFNSTVFNVVKRNTGVNITIDGSSIIEIDNNITFTVNTNSNGTLVVKVNNKVVTIGTDGKYHFNGTVAGNYTITAEVAGNGYYDAVFNSTTFKVIKHQGKVNITVGEKYEIGTSFDITINNNTVVNVTINGKVYTVKDGKVTINTAELASGNYTVIATIYESDKYYGNITSDTFEIFKHTAVIKNVTVPTSDVVMGKNATITVNMDNVTSGYVLIEVDGHNYTVAIINKVANLTVELPTGEYNATAYYLGDANYTSATPITSAKFKVLGKERALVNITIIGSDVIEIDNNITFNVTSNSNATPIVVKVNGKVVETIGNNQYRYNGTVAGNYTITAEIAGNEYYVAGFNLTTFKVIKHQGKVNITVENRYEIGSNFNITIENNTVVNVTINGVKYNVAGGKVVIDTTKLAAGNYTVIATVFESDKYYGNVTNKTFEVFKHTAVIDSVIVPTENITVGKNATIVVNMGNVTRGTVLIEVGGHNYTVEINENGVATLVVELPAGSYNATAYYLGDENYTTRTLANNNVFNVTAKKNATIIINNVVDVEVGGKLIFNVTNSTPVVVTINDVVIPLVNGNYTFDATQVGNYTIIVKSAETGEYYAGFNSTAFSVYKHTASVVINGVENTTYEIGSVFHINVTTNSTGLINITVNGKSYVVANNSNINLNSSKLAAGHYIVTAVVNENANYTRAVSTVEFTINKHTAVIKNITVPTSDVVMGKNATITVNMDNVTSGYVLIEVDGHNYTVAIINKVANLTVELPTGEYTATAYYLGDANYTSATPITSSEFKVLGKERALVNITIIGSDVIEIDNYITFNVTSNSNATPLVVKVNGEDAEYMGNNQYRYNGTVAGNYTITAEIAGNEYYVAGFNLTTFKVIKHQGKVNITVENRYEIASSFNISIGNNTVVNVTINGIKYNVAGGKVEIDTTKLAAGNYTVIATVFESDKYYGNVTNKTFEIYKHTAVIDYVAVPTVNVTEGESVTITVKMGNVTTGTVLIEVGGHNYTAEINTDGIATLTVELPDGEYTAKAYYLGDANYTPATKDNETKFKVGNKTVTKVNITLDANVIEIDNNITFTVNTNSNGTLVVKVNGQGATHIADNRYTFNATVAGNYTITAEVAGNNYYTAAFNSTMFKVIKHNAAVNITVNAAYNVDEAFNITITNDTAVNVTINGKKYSVVDGKVIIPAGELPAGHYIITATIYESDKYNANSTTKEFDIIKYDEEIANVAGTTVMFGEKTTVTVTMTNVVTGKVIIEVNGTNYTVDIKDKVATLTVALPVGKYNATAYFLGDDKYNKVNKTSAEFEVVNQTVPDVEIIAPGAVEVENNLEFTVTYTGNATLVVKVDGKVVELTGDKYIVKMNSTGNFTITAEADGNKYYYAASDDATVNVYRHEAVIESITASGDEIILGNNVTVTVTMNNVENGTVLIEIDNHNYTVEFTNKVAELTVALPVGNYTARAYFIENELYNATASTAVDFKVVYKLTPEIIITAPSEVKVGETVNITLNTNGYNLTVWINDVKQTVTADGNVSFVPTKPGSYTIVAEVSENATVYAASNFTVFTAVKSNATLIINEIHAGLEQELTITVTNITDGKITIKVNGNEVTDGKFTPHSSGIYTVTVESEATDKYNAGFNVTTFTIDVKEPVVINIVAPETAKVGETIDITVSTNGYNLTVWINEVKQTVTDGVIKYTVTTAGINKIYAETTENITVYAATKTVVFEGVKNNATLVIGEINLVKVGDTVTITVTNVTDGEITVKVDGVEVTDAKFTPATSGNYTITVESKETGMYNAGFNSTTFEVIKNNAPVDITVTDHYVGEAFNITIVNKTAVNVTINGKVYTVADGKVIIPADELAAGHYIITAVIKEDNMYFANSTTKEFDILKLNSTVKVTVNPIKVDDVATIEITVPGDIDGTVKVDVNGTIYSVDIVGGTGSLDLKDLKAGSYDVNVTYIENDKYLSSFNDTAKFTVTKINPAVTVKVENITRGEVAIVNVTLPDDATGNVTVTIAGITTISGVHGGFNSIIVPGLPSGEYTVDVTYSGNYKYESDANSTKIKVSPESAPDGFSVDDLGNGTVIVTVPENATGTVAVKIGDNVYNATVKDGQAVIDLVNETPGTYNATVTYSGDGNYSGMTTNKSVTIPKYGTEIMIDVNDTNVGDVAKVIVTLAENVTGNVTIEIDGKKYTNVTDSGVAVFNIEGLLAGNKTVTVTYAGDKWYVFNSTTSQFKVSKVATTVNITVSDHYVDEAFEIGIENDTAVTVTINGKEYSVADGKVSVPAGELAAGHYIVTATIVENDRYITDSNTKEFNILKRNSTVNASADSIKVGEVAKITITVPSDIDGVVTVNVNGTNYTLTVKGGIGELEIKDLKAGTYDVNVTYTENAKYLSNSNITTFEVSRWNTPITVNVTDITYGESATVNVTLPDGTTGYVTIKVNNSEKVAAIINGIATAEFTNLAYGKYDVSVTYDGNAKYLSNDTSSSFTVKKSDDVVVDIEVSNITYGQVERIIVYINATGNATIKVGNLTYEEKLIENGKIILEVPDLNATAYTVEVTYNGNNNYNETSATAEFTVAKADLTINIDVSDITYGQVENIKVTLNATGNVTIKVHTTDETVILNPGAEINVLDLPAGKYTVEVTYNGNDNYNSLTQNATFNVAKANTTVDLEIESSVKWGETQTLNITVSNANATGEVIINIDGKNYAASLTNGTTQFLTPQLPAGNHTVTIIYNGDANLNGNWTSKTLEVLKANAEFNVTVENVDAGEDATIKIAGLPDDATGYIIVNVNGTEYGINITESKEVTVPINKAGTYTVAATYLGDDKYASSTADTTFNATKVSGNVTVEISDAVTGGDVTVKVTVSDDATGNVTVTVGNTTKTVPVTGGENTIIISNVTEGENNVTVTYSGDDKYDSKTVTETIYVTTSIKAQDKLTRGWDSPYDFEAEFLDKQGHVLANTEVKFVVNGKTYTAKTDEKGIARLTDSNLAVGTYDVTCINPVTGQEVTKQVTIVKRIVENKDVTMDFRDGSKYTVRVIGDNGKPVGAGEFVAIKINGITYAAKTDKNGYARLTLNLNPKKYTVTAEYKNTKVSNKVTIKQTLKLVKKTVKVKKGKKLVLKAKLKWSNGKAIKGKKIVFKFKGKKYKAKTNKKGVAKVTIKKKVTKKLKKGKKYKFTASYFSNTVKGKVKVKK